MQQDPYKTLELNRTATDTDIKAAYRRLAKKHHPDANPHDDKSKDRFASLNQAYEILGDKNQRARYDRGEIDANGNPAYGNHPRAGGKTSAYDDIRRAYQAHGQQPNADGFAFTDGNFGFGANPFKPGSASNTYAHETIFDSFFDPFDFAASRQTGTGTNPKASLKGENLREDMPLTLEEAAQGGEKEIRLTTGKTVKIKYKKGIEDGQVMRLTGLGYPPPKGANGISGDAMIRIRHVCSPDLRLENGQAIKTLNITLDEAILGAEIPLKTLNGDITLKVPKGITGAERLRLKSKGWPDKTGVHTDMIVEPRIILPQNDGALERVAEEIRNLRPYHAERATQKST